MPFGDEKLYAMVGEAQQRTLDKLDKIFSVASVGGVYAEPIRSEPYTVINTSELIVTMGLGFGVGGAEGAPGQPGAGASAPDTGGSEPGKPADAGGGGGGGGGFSMGRPVAAVVIGPEGVQVKPVVDVTKLGIAMFTAVGAMWMAIAAMNSKARRMRKMV